MADYLTKNWKHIYFVDIWDFKITGDSECGIEIHSDIVGICGMNFFYI